MKEWIESLRLPVSSLAGILTIAGLRIAELQINWLLPVTVLSIACATMVQNDWKDRFHDVKKGKKLAFNNPKKFLVFTILMWSLAILLIGVLFYQDRRLTVLPCVMVIVGILYSNTLRTPLLPTIIVALASASSVTFPIFMGYNSVRLWLVFFATASAIFGREIIKDLEDIEIDQGYKWTIPLSWGKSTAKNIAGISIGIGLILGTLISPKILISAPFFLASIFLLLTKEDTSKAKIIQDLGMIIILVILVL